MAPFFEKLNTPIMSVTTTKTKVAKEKVEALRDISADSTEYQGKPVYYYRSMISEMSLCGSDLMLDAL